MIAFDREAMGAVSIGAGWRDPGRGCAATVALAVSAAGRHNDDDDDDEEEEEEEEEEAVSMAVSATEGAPETPPSSSSTPAATAVTAGGGAAGTTSGGYVGDGRGSAVILRMSSAALVCVERASESTFPAI